VCTSAGMSCQPSGDNRLDEGLSHFIHLKARVVEQVEVISEPGVEFDLDLVGNNGGVVGVELDVVDFGMFVVNFLVNAANFALDSLQGLGHAVVLF
jgi:hypothetical protein